MVISSIFNEKTIYLHTAWANDESGSGFSLEEFNGAVFIGNYTSSSATESGNFASYSWKRIDNIEDPDETIEDEDLEDDTEDDEEFIEDEEDDDDDGTYLDEDLEEDLIEIEAAAVRSGDNIASNQQANDSGIGNVNLLYGTNSGKSGYSVSGGFVLSDLDATIYDDAEEVKAVRITCDTASDTAYLSFGSDYLLDNLSEMSAGDVFTLSFDSRMSVLFVSETLAVQGIDGAKRMLLFDQSLDNTSDNEEIDNTGEWVHYSAQAVYEEQETSGQVFCISLKNMPAGSTLDIANLKIEEGSLETPWRQSEDEIAGVARQAHSKAENAQETANGASAKADLVAGIVSGTDTFDISVSGSLSEESAQIDIQVASESGNFTTPGEYTFSYLDSGWKLGGNSVTLSEYGITLNGTPAAGDTITVVYDNSGLVDDIDELNKRTDEISSDVGSLRDASSELHEQTNGLSEATSKLKTVQETTSKEMAGISKEMEGYRGCVVINSDEPSITIGAGSDAKTNLKITPEKMSFMNNGNEAASLSNDTLKADSAEITNLYMRSVDDSGNVVGTLGWIARANGHLSLKVIG